MTQEETAYYHNAVLNALGYKDFADFVDKSLDTINCIENPKVDFEIKDNDTIKINKPSRYKAEQ